jgi:hypothetical protein
MKFDQEARMNGRGELERVTRLKTQRKKKWQRVQPGAMKLSGKVHML